MLTFQTRSTTHGCVTRALFQYDAGYQLSYLDEHEHDEYLYVLSGTFVDQNQASGRGTFIHNRRPGRRIGPARQMAAPSSPS